MYFQWQPRKAVASQDRIWIIKQKEHGGIFWARYLLRFCVSIWFTCWTGLLSSVHSDYESKTSLFAPKLVIPNQSLVQSLVYSPNSQENSELGMFLLCYMTKISLTNYLLTGIKGACRVMMTSIILQSL